MGILTVFVLLLPMCLITAMLEAMIKIPERIRDRRAVSFLRKKQRLYERGY